MKQLNDETRLIITAYNAASVATVNDDGTPAVSPKATFVILDELTIAFGNIRSPGTQSNIEKRPAVELNFIDVLLRRAVRIKGRASVIDKSSDEGRTLRPAFEALWAPYIDQMLNFIKIDIQNVQLIKSPAYDIGVTADELKSLNLEKLNQL
jgi:predicted pyridoxine 5'-phosphate oxidase superfamily flavin-nucleotide-binding protein